MGLITGEAMTITLFFRDCFQPDFFYYGCKDKLSALEEILKKTGLGDEDFFFGPEDTELSFRLKKFGKIVANLDLVTFHKVTSSSNISGWLSRSYYETKGFLLLIKKTGNLWDKLIGYSYFLLRIPYFFILLIFKKREKDRVIGFFLGCFDFFLKKKHK